MARKLTPPTIEPAPAPPVYDELAAELLVASTAPTLVSVGPRCLINPEQVALIREQPDGGCTLFLAGNPSPFHFPMTAGELATALTADQ
jgi:hypothetical protein